MSGSPGGSGGWHAERDSRRSGGEFIELNEFVACGGEADLQAVDFAEPVLALGFVDASFEVAADVDQPVSLGWVGS